MHLGLSALASQSQWWWFIYRVKINAEVSAQVGFITYLCSCIVCVLTQNLKLTLIFCSFMFQANNVDDCHGSDWKLCRKCQLPLLGFESRPVSSELEAAGWYHGAISWADSVRLLSRTKPGTFLVRDSSDPRCAFTLSLQTRQGPLSVRLLGLDAAFRLEADPLVMWQLPVFRSVVALVQYYSEIKSSQSWIDWQGCCLKEDVRPIRPLYRHIPSLQHLSRLVLNRTAPANRLHLPNSIKSYLDRYPYNLWLIYFDRW